MIAADLKRMQRLRDQAARGGQSLDERTLEALRLAEAEALAVDGERAGAVAVHRVPDDPHASDCPCPECEANRFAVGSYCGEHDPAASYRAGVIVTKNGVRHRSRRATRSTPGASDDWELAPAAPAARSSSTKRLKLPKGWQDLCRLIGDYVRETCATLDDVAALERKLETKAGGSTAELEARVAALEERLADDAHAAAAANFADVYAGAHADGRSYRKGAVVTFGGSLWLATSATTSRPGKDDTFRLIVKRGKDA